MGGGALPSKSQESIHHVHVKHQLRPCSLSCNYNNFHGCRCDAYYDIFIPIQSYYNKINKLNFAQSRQRSESEAIQYKPECCLLHAWRFLRGEDIKAAIVCRWKCVIISTHITWATLTAASTNERICCLQFISIRYVIFQFLPVGFVSLIHGSLNSLRTLCVEQSMSSLCFCEIFQFIDKHKLWTSES